jgi:ribosome-associated toxin RatA of RatAB toxin-antitoxin module
MTHTALLRIAAVLVWLLGAMPHANAGQSPTEERLAKSRKAERYQVEMPHSSIKAGAARVHVRASLRAVRAAVTDFDNYATFITKFRKSKVLARNKKHVDVYLEVPILKGAAKVWAVVRVAPSKKTGDTEVITAKMLRGNVERLEAKWTLRAIDDTSTLLDLRLLIVPTLPVPGSLVASEAAYAADKAVTGLRDRAQSLELKP